MKKIRAIAVLAGIAILASCAKPSEKAAGTYNGNYTIGSVYSGTSVIATSGDNVNMTLTIPSLFVSATGNGITATASGDNVAFSFTSASTTDGDITAISGTLTGNSLAFSFTYRAGGFPISGTFAGTK